MHVIIVVEELRDDLELVCVYKLDMLLSTAGFLLLLILWPSLEHNFWVLHQTEARLRLLRLRLATVVWWDRIHFARIFHEDHIDEVGNGARDTTIWSLGTLNWCRVNRVSNISQELLAVIWMLLSWQLAHPIIRKNISDLDERSLPLVLHDLLSLRELHFGVRAEANHSTPFLNRWQTDSIIGWTELVFCFHLSLLMSLLID